MTAVHLAAASGHTAMLKVLASNQASLNAQESWGQTALMISTQRSRLDCMKELLHFGVDTELHDHHHGYTALHVACTTRDEETVLLLLDAGCDVHAVNKQGLSCLGVAIENKFYRAILLLIEYGAQMNGRDWTVTPVGLQPYIHSVTGKETGS